MKITVSLGPEKLTLDVSQNLKIMKLFSYSLSFAIVVMDCFKHGLSRDACRDIHIECSKQFK